MSDDSLELQLVLPLRFQAMEDRFKFKRQQMCDLLGINSLSSYDDYKSLPTEASLAKKRKANKEPDFWKLSAMMRRATVSLNWLAGRPTVEMWDADLLRPMRKAVRHYVTENPPGPNNHARRICELIRWTHRFDHTLFSPLLLAAVTRQAPDMIQSILDGADVSLAHPAHQHLADYLHLRPLWLLGEESVPFIDDLSHRAPAINILDEDGISNDTIIANRGLLKDLEAIRRERELSIDSLDLTQK